MDALKRLLIKYGVKSLRCRVKDISLNDDGSFSITSDSGEVIRCKAVILATGGCRIPGPVLPVTAISWPKTRHTILARSLPLYPRVARPGLPRNAGAFAEEWGRATDDKGRLVYEDFGELMFTHFGITGPTVLS